MSKITLTTVGSIQQNPTSAGTQINSNFSTIQTAMDNTLSRDGTQPNTMGAPIDMNSNRIVNLLAPVGATEPVRLTDLGAFTGNITINAIPVGGTTGQALTKKSNTNYDTQWANSSGTVISVGLALPADFTVSNSPVTTTGTLTAVFASTPTGTGGFVRQTSPTLITPVLGVATATTINKMQIQPPATTSSLAVADGKGFTVNNGLTLAGTDGTTITFQATDTYVGRATTDTFTNKTFDTAGTGNVFKISGTTISGSTGTGSVVFQTSPTLTTPIIGSATGTTLALTNSSSLGFAVGLNGSTNPSFQVDSSVASQVSGWKVTGNVTGGGTSISVIDSSTNSSGSINSKGSGTLNLNTVGATGYVNVGTQVVIGGVPAEADPLWVGGTLTVPNIGAIKSSATFNGTMNHNAIIWLEPSFGASAVVTDWGALRINDANTVGGYQLDAQYQLRIQNPTKGIINQSIYCEGVGKVGLGTSNAQAHLHINENTKPNTTPPIGTTVYFSGVDGGFAAMAIDAFGAASGSLAQMAFRNTRGTGTSPNTALQSGDFLGNIAAMGNDGAGYSFATASVAFVAGANWTSSPSHNTAITFSTTPTGGNFAAETMRLSGAGGLSVGTTTDPGAGFILATAGIRSQGASGGIGYNTGAGTTVVQATSRVTAVTSNTPTGQITMFTAAGSATAASFAVNCTSCGANDNVILNVKSGASNFYILQTIAISAGSFLIQFNTTGGTASDAPVIQYSIIKGAIS